MSVVTPSITVSQASRVRRIKSGAASTAIVLSLFVALIPLVFIVGYVVSRGWAAVTEQGWFTASIPILTRSEGPGMRPAIVGTLLITGAATAMAVPLGVLGGIYLNEYSERTPFGRFIRFLSDVMTGVPSIVMGIFVFTVWVLTFGQSAFG